MKKIFSLVAVLVIVGGSLIPVFAGSRLEKIEKRIDRLEKLSSERSATLRAIRAIIAPLSSLAGSDDGLTCDGVAPQCSGSCIIGTSCRSYEANGKLYCGCI